MAGTGVAVEEEKGEILFWRGDVDEAVGCAVGGFDAFGGGWGGWLMPFVLPNLV